MALPFQLGGDMKKATHEQVYHYWLDTCPICGGEVTDACRCMRNERHCKKGHQWRRLEDGTPVLTTGHGHQDLPSEEQIGFLE